MSKQAKSYRKINLRIHETNNIKATAENTSRIQTYSIEEIETILKEWATTKKLEYWLAKHEGELEDGNLINPHYHIVIAFKSPTRFEDIHAKFPYGDIEETRSLIASVQYLIHFNDTEKAKASKLTWSDVRTNCKDMSKFKLQSDSSEKVTLFSIIEQIGNGEIRRYDAKNKIPFFLRSKHTAQIDRAFRLYEMDNYNPNMQITVKYLQGVGGTGKTFYAKTWCEQNGYSYCITGGENDPLQMYQGQDVIIIDEIRGSHFKFSTILKMLDNNTNTAWASRYYDKIFFGHTIIITSVDEVESLYTDELMKKDDNYWQLIRRVTEYNRFEAPFGECRAVYIPDEATKNFKLHEAITWNDIPSPRLLKHREEFNIKEQIGDTQTSKLATESIKQLEIKLGSRFSTSS